jgi:hypothetical protein
MAILRGFVYAASLTLALTLAPGENSAAQTKAKAPAKPTQQAEPDSPVPSQILIPDSDGLAILIDNTVIALSQANLTGNYSVLRDLGAPEFQKINSPQRLADIFANMRARNLNLSPIVLHQPKLAREPVIDDKGFLRMTGFYETQPLQVHFDLAFQPVAGSWRLFEISVWTAMLR